MAWETCCNHQCKCQFWLPDALKETALARRGADGVTFFCPYGHRQWFVDGETPEEKLRRERDRLAQRVAEKNDEIARQRDMREGAERRLAATRGVVTRIKNRVGHGICPCCNRTFGNLSRHMATKHPTYATEAAE